MVFVVHHACMSGTVVLGYFSMMSDELSEFFYGSLIATLLLIGLSCVFETPGMVQFFSRGGYVIKCSAILKFTHVVYYKLGYPSF